MYLIHYSIELTAFSAEYILFNNCNFNLLYRYSLSVNLTLSITVKYLPNAVVTVALCSWGWVVIVTAETCRAVIRLNKKNFVTSASSWNYKNRKILGFRKHEVDCIDIDSMHTLKKMVQNRMQQYIALLGRQQLRGVDLIWNVMAHAQKPDFVFRRNERIHLNRRGGRQFSRLLAAEMCVSAVVMLDTHHVPR
jgi:hypothetical protein